MHEIDGLHFAHPPAVILDPRGAWDYAREPILRPMPDGSLVCLHYSGGPDEPHDDNLVLITRSADGGESWSPPEVLFEHPTRAAWATELFTGGPRPCAFVHTFDAASGYAEIQAFRSFTNDGGRTWSEPTTVPGGAANVSVRQGVVLSDGAWVFPVYWIEQWGQWAWRKEGKASPGVRHTWRAACGVIRSDDGGESFSLHGYLRHGRHSLWEPNVVETAPGELLMLMRAEGANRLFAARSADGGRAWTPARPTDIPSADSKVTLLKVGDAIVLLHNPAERIGWHERTSLELWVSRDGGRTWPVRNAIVRADRPQVACYPHAFVDARRRTVCVAVDTGCVHYLLRVGFDEFV